MSSPLQAIADGIAVGYSGFAGLTFMTWDMLIFMADEVELIWKRPRSLASIMYVLARYLFWILHILLIILASLPFDDSKCTVKMALQMSILQLTVFIVESILVMRVHVLFNHNKTILVVVGLLFTLETIILCIVVGLATSKFVYLQGCEVLFVPTLLLAYWITSLLFEAFLLCLTLVNFFHAMRRGARQPILRQFVVDGVWAFALVFATMVLNVVMYEYVRQPLGGIGFTWLLPVMSFAASHLLLNARRLVSRPTLTPIGGLEEISFHISDYLIEEVPMHASEEEERGLETPK